MNFNLYRLIMLNLGSDHYLEHPGGREKNREGHELFTFRAVRVMNFLEVPQWGSWTFDPMVRVMNFLFHGEGRELLFHGEGREFEVWDYIRQVWIIIWICR